MSRFLPGFVLFLLWIICVQPVWAAKQIALSFDDAPRPDSACLDAASRRQALLEQLKRHSSVPAIFMVTTKHLEQQGRQALQEISAAGQWLGNHSHSHRHPAEMGVTAYLADVATAHQMLASEAAYHPYYRFPFLDEGRDEATRDGIRQGLQGMGLQHGYVTIDNYDWYMDHLLQRAIQQSQHWDAMQLRDLYVHEMMASINFYDTVAQEYLGRSPRHVLLMHENDLAALFLDALINALHAEGWQLISPELAYQDALADELPATLFNNQGRVAALAHLRGASRAALVPVNEEEAHLDQRFATLPSVNTGTNIQELCTQARMRLGNN